MSDKTLTRMDLSEAVFREVGLSRNESAQLVESVLQHMSDALVGGEVLDLATPGTRLVHVGKRSGRHSKDQKTIDRLIVEAALTGDSDAVYHAVMLDPLTAAVCTLPQIHGMVTEMLDAQAQWLPQF